MAGKIQIVNLEDVEQTKEEGGLLLVRHLITRAHGSERFEFEHVVINEGLEGEGAIYPDQDELVYVIKGECELGIEGQKRRVGPGGTFFVPANTPYDFKTIKAPIEVVAVFSPPND